VAAGAHDAASTRIVSRTVTPSRLRRARTAAAAEGSGGSSGGRRLQGDGGRTGVRDVERRHWQP